MNFRLRPSFLVIYFLAGITLICGAEVSETLNAAKTSADAGDFKQAANILISALQNPEVSLSAAEKKEIEWQVELLSRVRKDFSFTERSLYEALDKSLTGLSKDEFMRWIKDNRFDSKMIDGVRYFVGTSVSNLYFRFNKLNARRRTPKDDASYQKAILANCRAIKAAAENEGHPYVLPQHFKLTMKVIAEKDVVPASEIIRAWMPIPRRYLFQKEYKLLSSSSRPKYVAEENSPLRSIYLEQPARQGKPTEFRITYEYTMNGISFSLLSSKVKPANKEEFALKPFLGEGPHILFSEKINELAERIAGSETNQMLRAQAFYNWMADNIKYSYAREYSTLTNISDYCANNGYGDCGQEALLFITLCRSQGIPARWQTGWFIFPGHKTIHDWTEIYLAPYGWVPVDPYMGIFAMRYTPGLAREERREIRDFYFGGLDQFRMIANSDHNQNLQPAKKSFRSDDVDFQRGELESGNDNIYFDKFSYELIVDEPKETSPK